MPPKRRGSIAAPAAPVPAPVVVEAPAKVARGGKKVAAVKAASPGGAPPPHIVINNKSGPPALLIKTFNADGSFGHTDEGAYTPSHQYMSDSKERTRRAYLPPAWVVSWFWLTTLIVSWDASYSLLGPWSHNSSDPIASRLYYPYQKVYSSVDLLYGNFPRALGVNAFGPAQSVMNVVEILVNILFLFLAVGMESPSATVVGLIVTVSTLSKTILYALVVHFYGWAKVVPSAALTTRAELITFVSQWLIPNGIWIVVPFFVVVALAQTLAESHSRKR